MKYKIEGQNLAQLSTNDILDAKKRLAKIISPSPLVTLEPLNLFLKHKVYLKAECLLPTGSFKLRGAFNKISYLKEKRNNFEVVTASSGNHGFSVSFSSRVLGVGATIVVPTVTPRVKIQNCAAMGANVIEFGQTYDSSFIEATRICNEKGAFYIHPVSDVEVLAGQGTIGMEILSQLPDVEQIVVPLGGGGLISGIGYYVKNFKPDVKIIAVMPENSAVYKYCREAGKVVELDDVHSIADAVVRKTAEEYLFPYIEKYVDEILVVKEDTIPEAIRIQLLCGRLLTEGAGALPMAAAIEGQLNLDKKTVFVASGSNIDESILKKCL